MEDDFNVKTYKYKAILSNVQTDKFNRWISLCKEVYNLMIEQRIAIKTYNDEQYYLLNPQKADEKQKREDAYQAKIDKEILEGRRQPKKLKKKSMAAIKFRHPELQNIETDVLTYISGHFSVNEIKKLHNPNQDPNKPVKLRISWQSQTTFLTSLKEKYLEYTEVPADLLAYTARQVDQAFKKYEENLRKFKKGDKFPLPPKFVSHRDDFSMTYMRSNGFKIKDLTEGSNQRRIFGFPKCKEGIKVRYHKPINGVAMQQAIIKEGQDFYLCVTFKEQKVLWPFKQSSIGIDLGVVRNVQLSDGTFKQLPVEQIKLLEKRKANLQRGLKRMTLKSRNYYKAQNRIAKIDKRIANIRKYHLVMFATEIARDNDTMVIEDLKIKNMTKSASGDIETPGKNVAQKSGLNKSILRVSPYMFRLNLENKSKEYGRTIVAVDPRYTSQTCSGCGVIDKESRVDQEHFECTSCGMQMNADHNASVNILNKLQQNV